MKTNIRRLGFAILLFAMSLVAFGPVGNLQAAGPTKDPLPYGPSTITGYCSFDIDVIPFHVRHLFITTFSDANGNPTLQVIHGDEPTQVINKTTGKTLTYNTAGTIQIRPDSGGQTVSVVTTGPLFLLIGANIAPYTQPTVLFFKGRSSLTGDNFGNILSINALDGYKEDLCQALSS